MHILNHPNSISAIILAGGNSHRMGYPKPWLPYKNQGTFLNRIIDVLNKAGIEEVVSVLNHRFVSGEWYNELGMVQKKSRVVLNLYPDLGRLYSLRLGLENITTPFALIQNVDNPFINAATCQALLPHEYDDVVIPLYDGITGHPVVVGRNVMNEIILNYRKYSSLRDVLKGFITRYVDVMDPAVHKNINTPGEYFESIR